VTAFAPGLPANPGVSLRKPTITKTITYEPHSVAAIEHDTIAIPRIGIVRSVKVFMPPGTNYSVRVQIGFNGQRNIPTESSDDYLIGSGVIHEYPWEIQIQREVDVWAWCWNANPHTISVTLEVDYNPFIPAGNSATQLRRVI